MDEQELSRVLQSAVSGIGQNGAAAQQLAQALQNLSKQTNNQTTASSVTTQVLQQMQSRATNLATGFNQLIGAAVSATMALTTVSSSIYGTDKAFTSVIPTLDAVNATFGKIITAFGMLGSGASIAQFSFGRASEAVAAFASTTLDIMTNLAKFQLETSQKMADASVEVAKFGASFGGGITTLVNRLAQTGIPLQMFSKMVANNAEDLGRMGLGMKNSALKVAGFTQKLIETDDRFIALYGSFDEVAKGVAQYQALQTQLGDVQSKDIAQQAKDTGEYLLRMREISAITGKQAETLKKEEEGRRRQLDYNLKLGRLGEDARKNVMEGMAVAGKIFGDQGAKYAEEYFATGGKIFSKEALTFQAMNQEAANAIAQMFNPDELNRDRAGYREGYSNMLKQSAPQLEAFAKSMEDFAELNRSANNPILKSMTETGSSIVENLKNLDTIVKQVRDLEDNRMKEYRTVVEERKRLIDGVEVLVKETVIASLDPAAKAFATATREMISTQTMIDQNVLKNMQSMTELVVFLNQITKGIVTTQQTLIDTIRSITNASVDTLKESTTNLAKEIFTKIGFDNLFGKDSGIRIANFDDLVNKWRGNIPGAGAATPATPANATPAAPTQPPTNAPTRADGGITRGPTIAGENGVEAVIPLAGGSIPMQIDFEPVIRIMQQNNVLTKEMLDTLSDMTDVQRRILDASY